MTRNIFTEVTAHSCPTGTYCRKQIIGGFTMLEILIAIVIVLLGVLGLAGLIVRSNQAELESYQRVQALMLTQDMADRMNANRKNITAYAGATAGTGSVEQDCTILATGAALDLCQWHNALLGASEKAVDATNIGAMIGARGCVDQLDAVTRTYRVSVVWQGLVATAASDNTCGQGLYGDENLRRVVSVTLRIGTLL